MVFEQFDPDVPLSQMMPHGMYLIIMEEPIDKVGTFNMEETVHCAEENINIYSGKKLSDVADQDRGLWKM